MIVSSQLTGLQASMAAMSRAQQAVSTGRRLNSASDDPVAASSIMASGSSLRAIEQYRTNVNTAAARVSAEDGVLQQLSDLLTRGQELAVQQASANISLSTRSAALGEAKELLNSAINLANTKYGDAYLFGGDEATAQPFTALGGGTDYSTTTPAGQLQIQIGVGRTMAPNHDGSQVFLSTGVLDALKQLVSGMSAGDAASISAASQALNLGFNNLQAVVGDIGARGNQLEMTKSNLDAFEGNVKNLKSNLEDVDFESAVTELMTRQTAYQAAMLATSKVLGLTLTDYLR